MTTILLYVGSNRISRSWHKIAKAGTAINFQTKRPANLFVLSKKPFLISAHKSKDSNMPPLATKDIKAFIERGTCRKTSLIDRGKFPLTIDASFISPENSRFLSNPPPSRNSDTSIEIPRLSMSTTLFPSKITRTYPLFSASISSWYHCPKLICLEMAMTR